MITFILLYPFHLPAQPAVPDPVKEIDEKSDKEPDNKANPGDLR